MASNLTSATQHPPPTKSFVAHAKLVGALTFASRILGLAREVVAANFFGAGAIWSAFTVAFMIPNLFRRLFGEGALSAAFIPLYAQSLKTTGGGASVPLDHPDSANSFANASVNLLILMLLAVTVLGEAALFIWHHYFKTDPETQLAIKLAALMFPYVLLVCLQAFLGAILQVHHRFGVVAAVPIVLNIFLITAIVAAAKLFDLHTQHGQTVGVFCLAGAVIIAGVLQVAFLWPSLKRIGFEFHPILYFWTPRVRRMLYLSLPVALSAGVLQISTMLDKGISFFLAASSSASHFTFLGHVIRYPMQYGAVARLNWAQYLYQFPLAIFATALATAIFPQLSRHAMDADRTDFKTTLRRGIEASLFIGLPASVGLIVVAHPAVALLFQHGKFTAHDTHLVVQSTIIYAAAIWAFSLQQILNRAYYALHDTKTPLYWGIANLLINLVVEIPLLWTPLTESAMAAGTLISFSIQCIGMILLLDRSVQGIDLKKLLTPVGKMVFASVMMLITCLLAWHIPGFPGSAGRFAWAEQLVILMVLGTGIYFGICHVLGLSVIDHLRPPRRRPTPAR